MIDLMLIVILMAAYNIIANKFTPRRYELAFALGAIGFSGWIAARVYNFNLSDIGLSWGGLVMGLAVGIAISLAIVGVIALGVAIPLTRPLFRDQRIKNIKTWHIFYETLLKIPISTVVLEELFFRGILLAVLLSITGQLEAIVASGLLFGFWHILPSIDQSKSNMGILNFRGGLLALVTGTIVGTALAGMFFAYVRIATDSLAAPIIVHYAINASSYFAAWVSNR